MERATGDGPFTRIASLAPDATHFTDSSLSPGRDYRYRLVAANLIGETSSVALTAYTAADPALALQTTPSGLLLSFDSQAAFAYELQRSENLVTWTHVQTTQGSTDSHALPRDLPAPSARVFYRLRLSRP